MIQSVEANLTNKGRWRNLARNLENSNIGYE